MTKLATQLTAVCLFCIASTCGMNAQAAGFPNGPQQKKLQFRQAPAPNKANTSTPFSNRSIGTSGHNTGNRHVQGVSGMDLGSGRIIGNSGLNTRNSRNWGLSGTDLGSGR